MPRRRLSKKFLQDLRCAGKLHETAWNAGITPNQLYKITSGVDRPSPDDLRMKALCKYLGISINEAFESDPLECKSQVG